MEFYIKIGIRLSLAYFFFLFTFLNWKERKKSLYISLSLPSLSFFPSSPPLSFFISSSLSLSYLACSPNSISFVFPLLHLSLSITHLFLSISSLATQKCYWKVDCSYENFYKLKWYKAKNQLPLIQTRIIFGALSDLQSYLK